MTECKDCIHYEVCEPHTSPNESFPEVGGCKCFKGKNDVVEVVRCKDCIYRMPLSPQYNYKGKPAMVCFNFHRPTREDGYCYEGIRRDQKPK